ncbi:MAG: apolipoprotein N-acyltransferase, partial [Planctomycetales bacterium 12-60-4]
MNNGPPEQGRSEAVRTARMAEMNATVVEPSNPVVMPRTVDRSAHEIIASARTLKTQQRSRASGRPALGLSLLSAVLLWASFPPWNWSPLAWLAPVPLFLLVRLREPTRRMYLAAYLGGLAFNLPALQWLRLGDPAMYVAWWALSAYVAAYFPLQLWLSRVAVYRWSVPFVMAAPIVWVSLEFAKAHLLTGFAWYFLGHTQYRWLELIQISDVVGAYGISFIMAASAAALASLVPESWFARLRLLPPPADAAAQADLQTRVAEAVMPSRRWPVFAAVSLVALTLVYGFVRRGQANFTPGPRVALIQGNFVASLRIPPEDFGLQYNTHMRLTALAVREQPDLIVWPESMFRWPLTNAPAGLSEDELQKLAPRVPPDFWRDTSVRETLVQEAQKTGAAMIYGIECVDLQTDGKIQQANSAVMFRPETGMSGRYDKMHLVPFGEYLPFKKTLPWLQAFTPYPSDFGLHPGARPVVFEHRDWRMLPVICFEDTVPHLVRNFVAAGSGQGGEVDLLVNLSND